jgi:uncharacterized OB-fold protein
VASFTVSQSLSLPGFEPPYLIALVEIYEQPSVRLVTNLVSCPPDTAYIGMTVRVVFEHCEDVWVPLFEPADHEQHGV